MEELLSDILAVVESARSQEKNSVVYVIPSQVSLPILEIEESVREALSDCVVNYMTITYKTGRIEHRLNISW
jgi:hypothetical protein